MSAAEKLRAKMREKLAQAQDADRARQREKEGSAWRG
jgi:hypothetical protein